MFASSQVLAGLGAGVFLALSPGLLDTDRARVRLAWPLARVVPLIPPPRNGDDTGPRPQVNVKPVKAPADFRTLPPWGTKSADGVAGSGIRFDDPASPRYLSLTHCADCGAANTRLMAHVLPLCVGECRTLGLTFGPGHRREVPRALVAEMMLSTAERPSESQQKFDRCHRTPRGLRNAHGEFRERRVPRR